MVVVGGEAEGWGRTKREATASPSPDAAPDTTAMWFARAMAICEKS